MPSESSPDLEAEIAVYVKAHLPPNPSNWFTQFSGNKIIHDALWGTFSLRPHEVAIIDTPLLQRLRFLRQTGAVYLTYPSAQHTRFEHTLGVLCQAGRLCEALRGYSKETNRINDGTVLDVRFAALLHDTGHGPFSHTSEQFFSGLPALEAYRTDHPEFIESGAGEVLSHLIVMSEPFREFVRVLNAHFQTSLSCKRIADMITGTLGPDHMYMSEIIHGPFDADKLDYMPRDGMFSGLKMHVDIDRLYYSIRITSARVNDKEQTRMAGGLSGLSPLTQIMFNKMLLFTGMYHHHKVRAVDCMLWAIFKLATERGAMLGGRRLVSPVDFLSLSDDMVLVPALTDNNDIKGLIEDIRLRRLWKKALCIARNTVPETMHDQAGGDPRALFGGIAKLAGDSAEKIQRRQQLAKEIWEAAKKPCKEHEVWLDVPKAPGITEAKEMWIHSPGEATPRRLEDFIPIKQWVDLYGIHQSKYHIFCPPHATEAIGKAGKDVFRSKFGLEFLPNATPKVGA